LKPRVNKLFQARTNIARTKRMESFEKTSEGTLMSERSAYDFNPRINRQVEAQINNNLNSPRLSNVSETEGQGNIDDPPIRDYKGGERGGRDTKSPVLIGRSAQASLDIYDSFTPRNEEKIEPLRGGTYLFVDCRFGHYFGCRL
jgi:hypothetical protein